MHKPRLVQSTQPIQRQSVVLACDGWLLQVDTAMLQRQGGVEAVLERSPTEQPWNV